MSVRARIVDRAGQDAGHVHCDIAVADHHHLLGAKVESCVAIVGMAVVPPDKCRCRMAPWQVLARDAETPVTLGAGGEQYLVVMSQHLCQREDPRRTSRYRRNEIRGARRFCRTA